MQNSILRTAAKKDLPAILQLQKLCYLSEAAIYNDDTIEPLTQTIEDLYRSFDNGELFLIAVCNDQITGSVRGVVKKSTGHINKLIVAPSFQNKGIGKQLMTAIETQLAPVNRYELFTGHKSEKNLYLYQKLNYTIYQTRKIHDGLSLVFLEKPGSPLC
ncbi:hypothetical protein A8C56_01610 [Niabella ginsenosidivorans]|uniref:N-acetyltransferase domain-containing protein n=1 Tax=Niabella ginsenosidivorans TaxID=1176587 RepID=A0A1A9I9A1_9BACT|nr:GNAT family N-acetyltransferase [Niabella ginsenosidivorans]ANH83639.1 hypothetical protein A8C56_01610 [Niabella ginsenosidivorans]